MVGDGRNRPPSADDWSGAMGNRERVEKLLPGLEPVGRYAAGCPRNKTSEGLCEYLYFLAGDSREIKKAIDERLDSRRRELRELAEAGLVEGKSYSNDPLWHVELSTLAREYESGGFDDSEEGAALRGILAEVCACDKDKGHLIIPEELMRRYVQLTFDSWREL